LTIFILTAITSGSKIYKVAISNPVESLRDE
jgi:hypothetical protein